MNRDNTDEMAWREQFDSPHVEPWEALEVHRPFARERVANVAVAVALAVAFAFVLVVLATGN